MLCLFGLSQGVSKWRLGTATLQSVYAFDRHRELFARVSHYCRLVRLVAKPKARAA